MCCCTPWFTHAGTHYTKHSHFLSSLSFISTFNTFLSCCWLQLGLLFYLFYFILFLCAMSHARHKTQPFLSFLYFNFQYIFKLLLTAARFVILPFLFYFFIFMCNVTRTTQHSPISFNFQYIFKLLLTAALFVILPFNFMCNVILILCNVVSCICVAFDGVLLSRGPFVLLCRPCTLFGLWEGIC